jgi:hypothetical protein
MELQPEPAPMYCLHCEVLGLGNTVSSEALESAYWFGFCPLVSSVWRSLYGVLSHSRIWSPVPSRSPNSRYARSMRPIMKSLSADAHRAYITTSIVACVKGPTLDSRIQTWWKSTLASALTLYRKRALRHSRVLPPTRIRGVGCAYESPTASLFLRYS